MARRKNTKRIDPRYFLEETVNRGEEKPISTPTAPPAKEKKELVDLRNISEQRFQQIVAEETIKLLLEVKPPDWAPWMTEPAPTRGIDTAPRTAPPTVPAPERYGDFSPAAEGRPGARIVPRPRPEGYQPFTRRPPFHDPRAPSQWKPTPLRWGTGGAAAEKAVTDAAKNPGLVARVASILAAGGVGAWKVAKRHPYVVAAILSGEVMRQYGHGTQSTWAERNFFNLGSQPAIQGAPEYISTGKQYIGPEDPRYIPSYGSKEIAADRQERFDRMRAGKDTKHPVTGELVPGGRFAPEDIPVSGDPDDYTGDPASIWQRNAPGWLGGKEQLNVLDDVTWGAGDIDWSPGDVSRGGKSKDLTTGEWSAPDRPFFDPYVWDWETGGSVIDWSPEPLARGKLDPEASKRMVGGEHVPASMLPADDPYMMQRARERAADLPAGSLSDELGDDDDADQFPTSASPAQSPAKKKSAKKKPAKKKSAKKSYIGVRAGPKMSDEALKAYINDQLKKKK